MIPWLNQGAEETRTVGPSIQRAAMVVLSGHSGIPVSLRCSWAISNSVARAPSVRGCRSRPAQGRVLCWALRQKKPCVRGTYARQDSIHSIASVLCPITTSGC